MQREFTPAIFLKIFYLLIGTAFIGFAIFITIKPNNTGATTFIPGLFAGFMGLLFIAMNFRCKVTITNDTITVRDIFRTREFAVSDVKGVRFNNKVIVIVLNNYEKTAINIRNYNDFGDSGELVNYMKGTFADLNASDREDEQKNLLENNNFGFTPEERQAKLDNAKKLAMIYNILGVILAVGFLFSKQPVLTVLALLYPLLSLLIIFTSKGLIKFLSNNKRSIYPFVFIGFVAPTITLFVKTLADYSIYNYNNFWLPFIGIGCIIATILFITGVDRSLINGVVSQGILMLSLSLFYAFGAVGQINCGYDKSPDQIYKASVLGHHISHGKSTSYYLYLSTWGPCHEQKQIDVGSKMYYETNIGDSVKVDLKAGLLHIPWFVVRK